MRRGVLYSSILHVAVLGLAYFHLWDLIFPAQPLEDTPIAVELVNIAPETRATRPNQTPPKPKAKPEDQSVEAPQQPPKQPPKPVAPPPAPAPSAAPSPTPAPQPQVAQAQPEPPKAEPKPEQPPPPPPPAPAPTPKPPPPEPPKPAPPSPPPPKPTPPPDPNKKKQDEQAFDALLKNLSKRAESQKTEAPPKPVQPQQQQQAKASSQPVAPLGPQLTTSEIDLVKQQIQRCWNPPAGARQAHDLIVDISAEVGPDGRVLTAQITSTGRMSDPFYRAAAESALRAVLNPSCSPLKLPPEKYAQWRNLSLTFNPKDLL